MRVRQFAAAGVATLSLLVSGCHGTPDGQGGPLSAEAVLPADPASGWTAGIIDRPRTHALATMLVAVRTAAHDGFDRTVFEFADRVPGYHIEYIDRPVRQCGSGRVTQLAGDGWLEVRMYPVHAHTEEGRPTVAERERMPDLPVLAELELTCDFEAVVTWVLGVESPNRYRVHELGSPPRLVIDVRH